MSIHEKLATILKESNSRHRHIYELGCLCLDKGIPPSHTHPQQTEQLKRNLDETERVEMIATEYDRE